MNKLKAFVKTTNGNFPNQNFYLAWEGFVKTGYDVIKFEESDFHDLEFWKICNRQTPVFAGVTVFDRVLDKLGVNFEKIDTYPIELHQFLFRNVRKSTIGEVRKLWEVDENNLRGKLFIKPVAQKEFNAVLLRSLLDWIPLTGINGDTPIWISDPVDYISEFRAYIQDGDILAVKHYTGEWDKTPNKEIILEAIRTFKSAPCAYALDFGVQSDGRTSLIEFNDGTSLGNYGLDCINYSEMIASRWMEITKL